jgi:hypothetical protein
MIRSLAAALIIAAAATLPGVALAQFPPPPPTGSQGVFPAPPPTGSQGVFPAAPQPGQGGMVGNPGGPGGGGGGGFGGPPPGGGAFGGGPPSGAQAICASFAKLKEDAEAKGHAIQEVAKKKDRKLMCGAVTRFVEVETKVVKFLADNKTTCGVPDQAVASAKASHEKTVQFRDQVCAEQPQPKAPSLSDAIGTPTLDTRKNTKTGKGTLDTLTGNPLAQ